MAEPMPFKRLPHTVIPRLYDLTLDVDLVKLTFDGEVKITCDAKEAVSEIALNANELAIKCAKWSQSSSTNGPVEGIVTYDKENQKAHISLPSPIFVGEGQLLMSFTGELNDQMKGFYRTKGPKDTSYSAVSQFEPTDARMSFPCWDEPNLKAEFDVTIIVDKTKTVISNMDEISSVPFEKDSSKKVVKFGRTPVMSTYLLAYAIGDYDYIEDVDSNGVKLRVYSPKDVVEHGRFALECSKKTLPFYAEFFGIKYPLPKSDLLAVIDFKAGAMENWGLVTYKEARLLMDPASGSSRAMQNITLIVGHELAHQWFGNLVTMDWWTDLWLNEGFAKWIEHLCGDYCHPEFKIWLQFINMTLIAAMQLDCLRNSHPIEVDVHHPAEVEEIFDIISYKKGASVIRMLYNFLGEDKFRAGLSTYLQEFKYSNAKTSDLWSHLGRVTDADIPNMMCSWTKQMGYPVLKIEQQVLPNKRVFNISQRRFLIDGSPDEDNLLWSVPISIATSSSGGKAVYQTVLKERAQTIEVESIKPGDFVDFNPGFVNMYHVIQPEDNLELLLDNMSKLNVEARMNVLFDLLQLAQSGDVNTVKLLKLIELLSNEDEYTVWAVIADALRDLAPIVFALGLDEKFNQFKVKLTLKKATDLGWDAKPEDSHLTILLRSRLINILGGAGHDPTVQEAKRRLMAHKASPISADLRLEIYSVCAKSGDKDCIKTLYDMYRESSSQEERIRVLQSLARVADNEDLEALLDFAMSDEVSGDFWYVFCIASMTPRNAVAVWKRFCADHTKIFQKSGGTGMLFNRFIEYIGGSFWSNEMADEVEKFFVANKFDGIQRTVRQGIEIARHRQRWISRDGEEITRFFI